MMRFSEKEAQRHGVQNLEIHLHVSVSSAPLAEDMAAGALAGLGEGFIAHTEDDHGWAVKGTCQLAFQDGAQFVRALDRLADDIEAASPIGMVLRQITLSGAHLDARAVLAGQRDRYGDALAEAYGMEVPARRPGQSDVQYAGWLGDTFGPLPPHGTPEALDQF